VSNPEWKTYAESGRVPAEGEQICVKYNFDNKWYRGFIDEVKQVIVTSTFKSLFLSLIPGQGGGHRPDPLQEAPQASWITLVVEVRP